MSLDPTQLGQWLGVYDGLIKAGLDITTDANTQFQFVSLPHVADWNANTNQYTADYWGNNAPNSLGPTTTGPQIDIADAYFEFINDLVLPVPSSPDYDRLKKQLDGLASQNGSVSQEALGVYHQWKTKSAGDFPNIKTYSDWLASSLAGGQQYGVQIDEIKVRITSVKQQLFPYEQGINAAYVAAVKAADPSNMVSVNIPGSSDTKKIYNTRLDPPLSDFITTVTGGADVHPMDITLSKSAKYEGKWHSEAGGSAGISIGFFSFDGSGGWTRDETIQNDDEFSCTLKVKGLQAFDIHREGWMKTNMIAEHKAGPFAGSGITENMFFGPDGTLKLVPTQILVSYGTTFSLDISNTTYDQTKEHWDAGGGISIGPFHIGGHGAQDKLTIKTTGNKTTVGLNSTNDHNAYIIGVSSMLFSSTD